MAELDVDSLHSAAAQAQAAHAREQEARLRQQLQARKGCRCPGCVLPELQLGLLYALEQSGVDFLLPGLQTGLLYALEQSEVNVFTP